MNPRKLIRITEFLFLGPFAVALVIGALAVVTAGLVFLVPGLLLAILSAVAIAVGFLVDLVIHPSLVKCWILLCFLAAAVLLYSWLKPSLGTLPSPIVRRGRNIEPEPQARQRAVDAVLRRREALRRHRLP
ncbi:MAG: hypothetical protein ACYC6N_13735 [Pirellulaceae bacterium]